MNMIPIPEEQNQYSRR